MDYKPSGVCSRLIESDFKKPFLSGNFVCFHKSGCTEIARNNGWSKLWEKEKSASLPVKVISPASTAVTF